MIEIRLPKSVERKISFHLPEITINQNSDLVRKRLTIVHELAHLIIRFGECKDRDLEKLCHSFASVFLLPKEKMIEEIGPHRSKISFFELKKLKGIYGISLMALIVRAKNLVIINDYFLRISLSMRIRKDGDPGKPESLGNMLAGNTPIVFDNWYHGRLPRMSSPCRRARNRCISVYLNSGKDFKSQHDHCHHRCVLSD